MKKWIIIVIIVLIIVVILALFLNKNSSLEDQSLTVTEQSSQQEENITDDFNSDIDDDMNIEGGEGVTNINSQNNTNMSTKIEDSFLTKVYTTNCYDTDKTVDTMKFQSRSLALTSVDWKKFIGEIEYANRGVYITNPLWQKYTDKDFVEIAKSGKVKIVKLSDSSNNNVLSVASYVMDKYGKDYLIPGIEFWQWLYKNQDQIAGIFEDDGTNALSSREFFFFGSAMGTCDSEWGVPSVRIVISAQRESNGGSRYKFDIHGGQGPLWSGGGSRVILIEK